MACRTFLTFNPDLEVSCAVDTTSITEEVGDIDTAAEMPLQHEWKVWEQIEDVSQRDYTDNMKPISTFKTVQEFWQLWNLLPQPSQLMSDKRMVRETDDGKPQMVDAIMIFRDNVKPMWEDPLNSNGGHFELRYGQTKDTDEQARLDEHWNNIVLGMVGATIEPTDMITGVRLVDKLHSGGGRGGGFVRIEIWFTDLGVPDGKQHLGKNLEKAMTTKLDGSRANTNIQMISKPHSKGAK